MYPRIQIQPLFVSLVFRQGPFPTLLHLAKVAIPKDPVFCLAFEKFQTSLVIHRLSDNLRVSGARLACG